MKGIVFTGDRRVEVREFADPDPVTGEVIVRIRASGMCGSDLHMYRAAPTRTRDDLFIQGHEPCGEVAAVGPGVALRLAAVGDRVMIHHYWGCGTCVDCRSGWPQLCSVIEPRIPTVNEHGGHAEFIRVPAIQTMPLPEEISFRAGAAIGCGTGTAWGALERLGDLAGKDLVVFGQGPVGLSATMFGSALGARVIAVDIAEKRLAQAGNFGADAVIDASTAAVAETIRELTRGRGADLAMETSGVTSAVEQALASVATWGRICLVGLGAEVRFNTAETLKKPMTILTSWTLSTVQQIRCADFVVNRKLPVDDLFTNAWSLDDAEEAYRWFDRQSDGKGVFEP